MKYEHIDGWVQPVRNGYRIMCCDCGLVHRIDFRTVEGPSGRVIQYRSRRDERATGQARRINRNRWVSGGQRGDTRTDRQG